jgi:endonuclease/exonuclease/phosphatase family metal-dependent hydrolase
MSVRITVLSWNVLHHVHALNWNEAPLAHHPDERERIAGIARVVARQLAGGVAVVALQEVSGDQLARLRAELPPGAAIFHHRAPRLPRPKRAGAGVLDDPTEHLVTVTAAPARVAAARPFANDPGKGFLAVELPGVRVVNAHVTWGEAGREQLALLAAEARAAGRPVILLGDLNAGIDDVRAGLGGAELGFADLAGSPLRTRAGEPGRDIDHVLAFGGEVRDARVLPAGGLSDHNLVVAAVTFPDPP